MDFSRIYPDVREQYDSPLKQSQAVMLRMLKILHFLCEKNDIKYFLTGGTCIGAIRHQGFIPWDDDLDIGMTRDNFNLFREKVVPHLPFDIFYQDIETDPYYTQCHHADARLRDKYSKYIHLDGEIINWHDGLQIDIFIYDKAFLPIKATNVITNYLIKKVYNNTEKRERILTYISKSIFEKLLVYNCNWMQDLGMLKRKFGKTYIYQKEIGEYLMVKFEDMEAYVLVGYDTILRRQYGDYMKLPPKEKRVSTHTVKVDPFNPCDHKEVLYWNERNK
nr:LicD family protein [uncultured Carboxylicivirga sp.]